MRPHLLPRHRTALTLIVFLLAGPGLVHASDDDHDRARQSLVRGDVLPLKRIMEHLERQRPGGHILEVELEQKGGLWVYEIKQLESNGQIAKIKLNAKTGDVLESKGRRH